MTVFHLRISALHIRGTEVVSVFDTETMQHSRRKYIAKDFIHTYITLSSSSRLYAILQLMD